MHDESSMRPHRALGLPRWQVVALAALALPRVFSHDLGVSISGPVQGLMVFLPPVVWVVVAVLRRIQAPVLTLLTVGGLYGVGLAVVHNVLWSRTFGDRPPELGGNLAGQLPPGTEELVFRIAAAASSLLTGVVVGLICGLVAAALQRWTGRGVSRPSRRPPR